MHSCKEITLSHRILSGNVDGLRLIRYKIPIEFVLLEQKILTIKVSIKRIDGIMGIVTQLL